MRRSLPFERLLDWIRLFHYLHPLRGESRIVLDGVEVLNTIRARLHWLGAEGKGPEDYSIRLCSLSTMCFFGDWRLKGWRLRTNWKDESLLTCFSAIAGCCIVWVERVPKCGDGSGSGSGSVHYSSIPFIYHSVWGVWSSNFGLLTGRNWCWLAGCIEKCFKFKNPHRPIHYKILFFVLFVVVGSRSARFRSAWACVGGGMDGWMG